MAANASASALSRLALKMGIKERERRVEVFLYGLFMDEELLRGKGLEPEGDEIAAIDGFALRIGQRAALVPTPGAKVYGSVFSLTRSELDRLYSESSVEAYKPQAVLAQLASGGVVAALCYNLLQPPSPTERNPEYAVKLRAVSQKVGLPAEYIASRDGKSFCLKPVRFDLCRVASADPWYGTAISVAGVITTVLFVLGSPWIVWRGSRKLRRAAAFIAAAAFVANSQWYGFYVPVKSDLGVGYFLWCSSLGLLAIGLFFLAGSNDGLVSTQQQSALILSQMTQTGDSTR